MFRRHAITVFVAVPLLATVSLTSLVGCSDDNKATPQVIFDGSVEHGTGNDCREDGQLFKVGDFGNQDATPPQPAQSIPDGQAFSQGSVGVACSVTAAGADQFNVSATVTLSGATGGTFRIDGVFKTTGEQDNIHAFFSNQATVNSYDESDRKCVVQYTTPFQGVAAGRVWGQVTCPHAQNASAQTSCQAIANFRFENCAL
jgi:hypothetical protein